jgi:hypothetical protein
MFSSTTPAQSRPKRGPRRNSVNRDTELLYISPISTYSYGSRVANQPKPPRLSETKVRLADGLQAKAEEVGARLKAEEEERDREAATRLHVAGRNSARSSMAPPSPPRSRYSREPSTAIEHSYSRARDPSGNFPF